MERGEERSEACYSRAGAPGTGNRENTIALGDNGRKMDKEHSKTQEWEEAGQCQE